MVALIPNSPKLVVPDSGSLIQGAETTPELMEFLNDIARLSNKIASAEATEVDDIAVTQLAAGFSATLQRQYTSSSTKASTTNVTPVDNTIPQIGEGAEYQKIAFTPKRSDSKILVEWNGTAGSATDASVIHIHKEGTNDAIAADLVLPGTLRKQLSVVIDSWGTSELDISLRFGKASGATNAYIGSNGGTDYFGGAWLNTLIITEFVATPVT